MSEVLVVLTNWKRPDNLKQIVPVFAKQDCRIVVVDNMSSFPPCLYDMVDDIWTMVHNLGPPCRFAPLFMETRAKYTLLFDDDMLPGENCLQHLLETADALNDRFSEIGEIGRRFSDSPWAYVSKNVRRAIDPVPVDMCCRAHFIKTADAMAVMNFRWQLSRGMPSLVDVHDDLTLLGIQNMTGKPSYLTPLCSPDRQLRKHDLPAPHAIGARPSHHEDRTRLIQLAHNLGWRRCW